MPTELSPQPALLDSPPTTLQGPLSTALMPSPPPFNAVLGEPDLGYCLPLGFVNKGNTCYISAAAHELLMQPYILQYSQQASALLDFIQGLAEENKKTLRNYLEKIYTFGIAIDSYLDTLDKLNVLQSSLAQKETKETEALKKQQDIEKKALDQRRISIEQHIQEIVQAQKPESFPQISRPEKIDHFQKKIEKIAKIRSLSSKDIQALKARGLVEQLNEEFRYCRDLLRPSYQPALLRSLSHFIASASVPFTDYGETLRRAWADLVERTRERFNDTESQQQSADECATFFYSTLNIPNTQLKSLSKAGLLRPYELRWDPQHPSIAAQLTADRVALSAKDSAPSTLRISLNHKPSREQAGVLAAVADYGLPSILSLSIGGQQQEYILTSATLFGGSLNNSGGHYTALRRNGRLWLYYNDTEVQDYGTQEFETSQAPNLVQDLLKTNHTPGQIGFRCVTNCTYEAAELFKQRYQDIPYPELPKKKDLIHRPDRPVPEKRPVQPAHRPTPKTGPQRSFLIDGLFLVGMTGFSLGALLFSWLLALPAATLCGALLWRTIQQSPLPAPKKPRQKAATHPLITSKTQQSLLPISQPPIAPSQSLTAPKNAEQKSLAPVPDAGPAAIQGPHHKPD